MGWKPPNPPFVGTSSFKATLIEWLLFIVKSKKPRGECRAVFYNNMLPLERAAGLVFSDASLKEVLLLRHVDDFAHPWQWVFSVVLFWQSKAL